MLKRLLASIALVSIAAALVLLVYWWRGGHGYSDTFAMGKGTPTETQFTSIGHGLIEVHIIDRHTTDNVNDRIEFKKFKEIFGYLLLVPGLWVAIKVRSRLPRPGRGVGAK